MEIIGLDEKQHISKRNLELRLHNNGTFSEGLLVPTYNWSYREAEAGGLQVQAQPELQSKLVQSLFGQLSETVSQDSKKSKTGLSQCMHRTWGVQWEALGFKVSLSYIESWRPG